MAAQQRVAAVGYRIAKNGGPEFLLVRTSAGNRWTFPKGGLEVEDATPAHGAEREAGEEAGVRGLIDPAPLCTYTHLAHLGGDYYREQLVEAYLFLITGSAGTPEAGRRPTWFAPGLAIEALAGNQIAAAYADELRRVIETAVDRLDTRVPVAGGADGR